MHIWKMTMNTNSLKNIFSFLSGYFCYCTDCSFLIFEMAPSKSKHKSLEFIFGEPLQKFDRNIKPTTFSVIKHWIYLYDEYRGAKRLV